MKTNQKIFAFTIMYLCIYMAFSIGTTQFIPFLTDLGFNAAQRGFLLSSISITTIIFQMIVGYLSDKYKTVKKFFMLTMTCYALTTYFFYHTTVSNFAYVFIMLALNGGFFNLMFGVSDNWVLESEAKVSQSFSFIRAFGSLGWGIGSVMLALILEKYSYTGIASFVALFSGICLTAAAFVEDANKASTDEIKLHDVIELGKNRRYVLLVIILFLIFSINVVNTYTVIDKMIALNASAADIGRKWLVSATAEIPMFFLGSYFVKKINNRNLLKIASAVYCIQFILLALISDVNLMIGLMVLQFFTYPMAMIASKGLIYECSSEKLKSTAQLVAMSVYNGVSALLIPSICGIITQYAGVNVTLLFGALLGMSAFLLIPVYNRI